MERVSLSMLRVDLSSFLSPVLESRLAPLCSSLSVSLTPLLSLSILSPSSGPGRRGLESHLSINHHFCAGNIILIESQLVHSHAGP